MKPGEEKEVKWTTATLTAMRFTPTTTISTSRLLLTRSPLPRADHFELAKINLWL